MKDKKKEETQEEFKEPFKKRLAELEKKEEQRKQKKSENNSRLVCVKKETALLVHKFFTGYPNQPFSQKVEKCLKRGLEHGSQ